MADVVGTHYKNSSLDSVVTLTKPENAKYLWIQAFTQNVRFHFSTASGDPAAATGEQIAAGDAVVFRVPCASVYVIEETASAVINYRWLKRVG